MAVYKVIQDIEAEDKLLGPLTLKQFIFATIAAGFGFVAFLVVSSTGVIYLAIPFLPFIGAFGVLAAPLSKEQPTDLWLAARIRFFIKPRKRIWDQSGIKELVTITAPKKEIKQLTNSLTQGEVKSRLNALANTLDSRGWAVKNVAVNMYANPSFAYAYDAGQDRLLDPSSLPQAVDDLDIAHTEDILDPVNPTAQHFEEMVQSSTANHKAQAIANMQQTISSQPTLSDTLANQPTITTYDDKQLSQTDDQQQPNDNYVPLPYASSTAPTEIISPKAKPSRDDSYQETVDEQELLERIKNDENNQAMASPHHKVIKTPEQLEQERKAREDVEAIENAITEEKAQAVTAKPNPDNIELAKANDLKVETISKLANRKNKQANHENGEVVINLR